MRNSYSTLRQDPVSQSPIATQPTSNNSKSTITQHTAPTIHARNKKHA